jgi:sporulation protein YlmC with PRC-barrel domain
MRSSAIILLAALSLSDVTYAQSTPPASSAPKFIAIGNNAILSSRLLGLDVQSASGESMGKIEDIAFEGGQIIGVVLSIGEALGSGQRYAAVDPSAISIKYMEAEGKWQATMNATLEQLRSAPEFLYEGKWQR